MYKCFYHSKDLDGRCSGAIVKKAIPDCKMIGFDYGDVFPWEEITKDDTIYMVDLSRPTVDELFRIEDNCKEFILIDHHKSTLEKLDNSERKLKNAYIELDKAACEIAWEVFSPKKIIPTAVTLLGRYDIWDHKDPRVKPFQMGMLTYDTHPSSDVWNKMFDTAQFILETIELGERITQYQNNVDEWAMNFTFVTEWEGLRFLCLNNVRTGSPQFDSKFDPEKHDAVLVFYRTPEEKWSIHMYTEKKELDLSIIAVKYGGGGHTDACACEMSELPF